jgi:hypothetical protein
VSADTRDGLNGVGETWAHIGNQEGKGILEATSNLALGEVASEEVCGDVIEEDASLGVVGLVVVNQKLEFAITIDIHVLHRVSLVNLSINDSGVKELATISGALGELIDSELLVEEFGSEYNKGVFIALEIGLNVEHDVRTGSNHMLGPGELVETLCGMLEPNELTLASLSVGTGCQEVFATITIDVDPLTGVIEESTLEGRDLVVDPLAVLIYEDIDTAIALAGREETIRNNDRLDSRAENVLRHSSYAVWPLVSIEQSLSLNSAETLVCHCLADGGDHGDLT